MINFQPYISEYSFVLIQTLFSVTKVTLYNVAMCCRGGYQYSRFPSGYFTPCCTIALLCFHLFFPSYLLSYNSAIRYFLMMAWCLMHSSGFYRKPGGIMPCSNPLRKKKIPGAVHTLRPNPVPGAKKPLGKFYRPPWSLGIPDES
jgi:hypothetical protein